MSRQAKGPRLYLRKRKGRPPIWVILDGQEEIGTGCGVGSEHEAEKILSKYLLRKHKPNWGTGDPQQVLVADVLANYAETVAPEHAHPALVGYHIQRLIVHFGTMTCAEISASSCRDYVGKRTSGVIGHRAVQKGTARRELETLSAALNHAYREKLVSLPIPLTLPEKNPSRERWLTRAEAARLLAGALGWSAVAYDIVTRLPTQWRRLANPHTHVALFVLIGIYTGTRHDAILKLRWSLNSAGGWVDLVSKLIYRRGDGQRETSKRRPPVPIPARLFGHLLRAQKRTVSGPVEYAGKPILKLRRGFDRACDLAHLGNEVTPHILRHTCATWLLQLGVSTWDVAGYLGTTEEVIRRTYGHHSPDYLKRAADAFLGHRLGAR